MRPNEYKERLLKEKMMTEHDIERLMQCVTCVNLGTCGCDESDEDEHGMCTVWERKEA
jgi:hypothetical protein